MPHFDYGYFSHSKKKDKNKSKIIPVKKTTHAKHKQTYSATTATSVVVSAPKDAPIMSTEPPTSTVSQNNPIVNPIAIVLEKKSKKGRIRKPRRVIPEVKDYIPEEEQPAPADVVGGRGGECRSIPSSPVFRLKAEQNVLSISLFSFIGIVNSCFFLNNT